VATSVFESGTCVGGYRLRMLLGEGASGIVYLAEPLDEPIRDVAVKVLRPERMKDAAARARFTREARLAGGIASRHVVRILEVVDTEAAMLLAMPYYAPGSLAKRLREVGRLSAEETVGLAAQLGHGLDALHQHEIVHRDVKPSNVLLDEAGDAALSDFGLALAVDSTRLTEEGQLLGTPHYLAPELIAGDEAGPASDIYALGCLLYQCLSGRPPFAGRSRAEVAFAHLTEPVPDLREGDSAIPAQVVEAILLALDKDPAQRPTSATALATMLHVGRRASPG
jgi:eukaryotic-like serine/threonine-protein kinase